MSEAHRTRLDREMYARLVAAYRVTPGRHTEAARAAGVDRRTAQKGWDQGFSYEWGKTPIREVVAKEQAAARSLLAGGQGAPPPEAPPPPPGVEADAQGSPADPEPPPGPRPAAVPAPAARPRPATPAEVVSDAVKSRAEEAQLARMTRSKALLLSGATTVLLVKGTKLADRLGQAIEQRFFQVGQDGKPLALSLEEIESGVRLLEKLASLAEKTAGVGLTSMKMEQELIGRAPTSPSEVTTPEQALAECREAGEVFKRAADRAAARNLRLVQGGAARQPPAPAPSPRARASGGDDAP